jgi:hypothetical protein
VLQTVAGVLVASALMGALVWLLETQLEEHWSNAARLIAGVATGTVVYLILLALISPPPYVDFCSLLAERISVLRRLQAWRLRSSSRKGVARWRHWSAVNRRDRPSE